VLIFWLMFITVASMALFVDSNRQLNQIPWIVIGLIFTFLMGFRDEVGGDWGNYLRHYENAKGVPLFYALSHNGDPAHQFLDWLMASWDLGVYGTNVIYSTLFMIGLIKFSRVQVYPWLTMTVAVPYLIIVVGMGFSRQAVAIGLFLLAVSYLQKGKFKLYVALIFFAALFHKTAILLLPLGIFLYGSKGIVLRVFMVIIIAYGAWDLLFASHQEDLWKNYVEAKLQAEGAKIRVLMNFIPSILLLLYRKEWQKNFVDYSFWFWIAIGSILSLGLVNFASMAVDRVALYFIPIQLVVFSRLPFLARKEIPPNLVKIMIILGYALVLFIWLNFANHAIFWLPYQNIIFQ